MKRAAGRFLDLLKRMKRKSPRRRWRRRRQIYEEDTQHPRGKQKGTVDPDAGEIIKGPVKGRKIEI
jgi:hypothetical protein